MPRKKIADAANTGSTVSKDKASRRSAVARKPAPTSSMNSGSSVYATTAVPPPGSEAEKEMKAAFEASHHHAEIAQEAYLLWLNRGCADGGDFQDWLSAIEIVRQRNPE